MTLSLVLSHLLVLLQPCKMVLLKGVIFSLLISLLKAIEKDFCLDIVQDTTDTLLWLDHINNSCDPILKRSLKCFAFDFKNLYDSISPPAGDKNNAVCNIPHKTQLETKWVLDLSRVSMKSANGRYKGKWYRPVEGIPNG